MFFFSHTKDAFNEESASHKKSRDLMDYIFTEMSADADSVLRRLDDDIHMDVKGPEGESFLIAVVRHSQIVKNDPEHRVVSKILATGKMDIDVAMENGTTALMMAAIMGNAPLVRLLLDKGARIDLRDDQGRTAFDIIRDWKNHPIVKGWPSRPAIPLLPIIHMLYEAEQKQRKAAPAATPAP